MKTLPSISGAWSEVRPSQRSSVSSDSPSTRRSISRLTHSALALVLIFCCSFISLRRRAWMVRVGNLELVVEVEGGCALFVGVGEDAEPVDPGCGDESFELLVVGFSLAGE